MPHRVRNLVADWRKGDAEKLALLETEADVAWPGGGGWQTTPEDQERHIRESNLIGAFVTENRTRIIGLCTVNAKPGQKEHAFVPHLNCHPDYHGKKHGKAVLRAAVECAHGRGYRKVDLYTWPGNMRAVPLYKKMGFMWQPDSSVHMENFTPAARRHPLGAAYFDEHDWYDTQVRSLDLEEDLVERGKVKVYEYLWRAGDGAFLRMVFDRQSWGIIEIENGDLLASCSLPDEKLVAGIPHPVRWRVVNKRPDPVRVFLNASGDPGIEIDRREMLEVEDAAEVEGTFLIDPDIEEKTQDPKAAILRTDLIVGDTGVELVAGIGVRQAVAISVDAPRSILVPGIPRNAVLTLWSNLDRKATARISAVPTGGAAVHRRRHTVSLDPKGAAELPVPLEAAAPGPVSLDIEAQAMLGGKRIPVKTKRIDLLAVERGGVSGAVGEESGVLCGGGLMVSVSLRRGDIWIYHRLRAGGARRLQLHRPRLGPPFSGEDLFGEKAEAHIERDAYGLSLRLRSRSTYRPGGMLDRRIALGGGPTVRVEDTIVNGSALTLDLSLVQGWRMQMGGRSEMVVPQKQGVYRSTGGAGGRGLERLDISKEGEQWPEGWVCRQRENGCVVGIIWDRAERVESGGWGEIRLPGGRLKPGRSKALDPIYALVGDGNWQTVRGWWQTLFGDGAPEAEASCAPTRRPIELGIEPNPLLVTGANAEAALALRSVGTYKLDGKIAVELPDALRSDVGRIDVSGLCEARPTVRKLRFSTADRIKPGPAEIGVRFETDEAVYRSSNRALILPPDAADVQVSREEGGRVIAIDNGILSVRVAPGFLGSVVSLQREGREYLNSAFPEAGIRGWMNPWHGGIVPEYGQLWGNLHKERFHYRVVARKGRQGLVWRGVRVRCTVQQEHARGQSIALDYLLAPGAGVLAIMASCKDELGIRSDGHIGFEIFPSFAASPGGAYFHNPTDESVASLAAPYWFGGGMWDWGGLVGEDGMALFLSARGEGTGAGGQSIGNEGCVLGGHVERPMRAGEKVEGLFTVVPASGLEDAEAHAVWSEFEELP